MANWVKKLLFGWIVLHINNVSIAASKFNENHGNHNRSVEGDVCTSIDNKKGVCVEVSSCKKIRDLEIHEKTKQTSETEELVPNSRCGWKDKVPLVCCSETISETHQPTKRKLTTCGRSKDGRMRGGHSADLGSWPWMVALGYHQLSNASMITFRCSATLISDQWLLTAAHCVVNTSSYELAFARLGDLDLDDKIKDDAAPVDMAIDKSIVHPKFQSDQLNFDIALIRMKENVEFTNLISPVCLLSGPEYESDNYYERKKPVLIGWGVAENGHSKTRLYEDRVKVMELEKCKSQYRERNSTSFSENMLCAGERGRDACQGDSGSPLMFVNNTNYGFYLGGIVSAEMNCGVEYSRLYIKVAKFIDWINDQTGLIFNE